MRTARHIAIAATLLLAVAPPAAADELERMQRFLGIMTDYLEVIETTHEISADAEKAAILQMQKLREIYENRGEKARAVEMLKEILNEARNPAIRNAAYIMIGDTLKEIGRSDEALDYLRRGIARNRAECSECVHS